MRNPIQANGKIAILALVTMAGLIYHSTAYADENDAKNLLKAMSDYVGAQKSISFDYDTVSKWLQSTNKGWRWQVPARSI
jgi:hypothetical protein